MERPACGGKGPGLSTQGNAASEEAARQLAADRGLFGARLFEATPRAWAVRALVAANVLVFLAMLADGAGLITPDSAVHLRWGANFGPITKEGQWWRLFACIFIHFGLLHLALNMWALWGAGNLVERLYGNAGFLGLYLFAGLTGSFTSLYWNADRVVSAGASGAIFGVYGALGAYILRQRGSVPPSVLKSLAGSTLSFIVYTIAFGAAVPGIDNAAHAGGLAGGFFGGVLLARPLVPRLRLSAPRALVALVAAVVSLAALFAWVPPARYSYSAQKAATATIQAFTVEEQQLAQKAQALVEQRREGRMTDRELGEGIERELLPGWNGAYERFAAIRLGEGAPAAARLRLLTDFVGKRRDMFAEYAAGLKSGDREHLQRAEALSAQAQALVKTMRDEH